MFRRKKMKINGIFKLLPNLNDKNNYKETLTQAAHHIVFYQTAWLKSYID